MIIENVCFGRLDTSYHTFNFSTSGMSFIVSPGFYSQNGEKIIESADSCEIEIPTIDEDCWYEMYLTKDGISLVQKDINDFADAVIDDMIDLIAWFGVPKGTTSLDSIEINVKYVKLKEDDNESPSSETPSN